MSNKILPAEQSYANWIDNEDIQDLTDGVSDLAEYAPYIKYVVGAYKWYRTWRAKSFIRTLGKVAGNFSDEQRKNFERVIKSDEGSELLAQYIDTVIRTSSKTAIAALALLYADIDNKEYSPQFKLTAALALEGISETLVGIFLELSLIQESAPLESSSVPYQIVFLNDNLVAKLPESGHILSAPESRVAIVKDLIHRGLLLPDYSKGRIGGGGVCVVFGISGTTRKLREMLRRARNLLPESKTEDSAR